MSVSKHVVTHLTGTGYKCFWGNY